MSARRKNASAAAAEDEGGPEATRAPVAVEAEPSEIVVKADRPVPDPVRLFNSWCKGCGICVAFCPTKTLGLSPITGKCIILLPETCTKCGLCELRCPDFAITVVRDGQGKRGEKNG